MKAAFALISLLLLATTALAKDVAMVTALKGNAFVFGKGFSRPLKFGSKVQDMTEIMVEDDSVISIEDYADHSYHLTGGTHIKFFNNVIEVKAGKVWVHSRNQEDQYIIQSANGVASFGSGQFVFSFDNYGAKTQLLVMQGSVEFHNVLQSELTVEVHSGQFSLIDKDYNDGLPRTATKVGVDSYRKMKMSFAGIDVLERVEFDSAFGDKPKKVMTAGRAIASVGSTGSKGKLYFISNKKIPNRVPASAEGPMKYYQDFLKNKKTVKKASKKVTPVRIFGGLDEVAKNAPKRPSVNIPESSRQPASVNAFEVVEEINNAFDKSLHQALEQNKRHSDEVNSLINDLKSYDKTYQKNY